MPAAGRRRREPVRHSVRLSGPRRRRRLLSPDARGPPGAARSSRGPARRLAPPPPGPTPPSSLSVRQSARLPARSRFRPSVRPPDLGPSPRSARFVSPRLAVSLSLPSRCLTAPPSLPILRSPSTRSSHPLDPPFLSAPIFQDCPQSAPTSLGSFPLEHPPHPQESPVGFPHILWGPSLPSAPQTPGVLPPLSPHFLRIFPLLVSLLYAEIS